MGALDERRLRDERSRCTADWQAASGNYRWMAAITDVYNVPSWGNALLFAGAILWESAAAILPWRAPTRIPRGSPGAPAAFLLAFLVSLPLSLALMVADEFFVAFLPEAAHLRALIGQTVTLILLLLLRLGSSGGEATA